MLDSYSASLSFLLRFIEWSKIINFSSDSGFQLRAIFQLVHTTRFSLTVFCAFDSQILKLKYDFLKFLL